MKKVYVLAYYDEDPDDYNNDELHIAGVFDSKEACEALKRSGDTIIETTYFDHKPIQMPPWNIKEPDWGKVRTTCTGTSGD